MVPFLSLPRGEPELEGRGVREAMVHGVMPLQSKQGQAVPSCPLQRKGSGVAQEP